MGKCCIFDVALAAWSTGKYHISSVTITSWSTSKYTVNDVTVTAWSVHTPLRNRDLYRCAKHYINIPDEIILYLLCGIKLHGYSFCDVTLW